MRPQSSLNHNDWSNRWLSTHPLHLPSSLHHILWHSCHLGPLAEGALTPTSPELGTAAARKPVRGGGACTSHYKPLSVSLSPFPVQAISASSLPSDLSSFTFKTLLSFSLYSPSLILHLNSYWLEFRLLLCWPSLLWVHLKGGEKLSKYMPEFYFKTSTETWVHPQTWIPMERHLRSASLCALLSAERCATAEVVAVAVMVMVLLVTCWLAGPCTWALAASMAAVRAFMLSILSVELDRPGWELMPVRGPEPPSI